MTVLTCPTCKNKFESDKYGKTYCSESCKKYAYRKRAYERFEGDWIWYFKGLINSRKDRQNLTPELLEEMVCEQDYKCALSGVRLTCIRKKGVVTPTNASIDRINPGKEYNIDNVQLVCRAINTFRSNMNVKEFINWCQKVTYNAIRKQKETTQKRIQAATRKGRT